MRDGGTWQENNGLTLRTKGGNTMARDIYDDWTSPIGGKWAYMVKNRRLIGEFIQANAINPAVIAPIAAVAAPAKKTVMDLSIRGGIRAAHLHFNQRIYMLSAEQWAKFSGDIIADCKAKLAKVKEVSFEEGMLLGNIGQTFGGG